MKADLLPSGSYRCRIMIDGKTHAFTRPTEAEAIQAATDFRDGIFANQCGQTLKEAALEYIELREAVLSASTVRGYKQIVALRLQGIINRPIESITQQDFQRAVNADLRHLSPKSMQSAVCFFNAVIEEAGYARKKIRLPQIVRNERAFLDGEQLRKLIKAAEGHKHEAAILLLAHGLRASEVLNIKPKDISGGFIHVRGAAVLDEDYNLVHQRENKNPSSRRDVPVLIQRLNDIAHEAAPDDYIAPVHNSQVLHHAINALCRKLDLPEVGCHGLRHSFCSLCYSLGISEKATMALGGWSDFQTMRKIYTHLSQAETLKEAANIKNFFDSDFVTEFVTAQNTRVRGDTKKPTLSERDRMGIMVEAAGIEPEFSVELGVVEQGSPGVLADYTVNF